MVSCQGADKLDGGQRKCWTVPSRWRWVPPEVGCEAGEASEQVSCGGRPLWVAVRLLVALESELLGTQLGADAAGASASLSRLIFAGPVKKQGCQTLLGDLILR